MDLKLLKQLTSNLSVLYVEDDEEIALSFQQYLKKLFSKVDYRVNGEEGLKCFKEKKHDIIITDIKMPKMNGLEMSKEIKKINLEQNILIISAYSEVQQFLTSIEIGIDGYIIKPVNYETLNTLLYKTSKKIKTFKEHKEYQEKLESSSTKNYLENIKLKIDKIDNYEKTLYALIDIIESRDPYTGKHSLRVANYSKLIAEELGFSKEECEEIHKAGILHDIGKIAIPDSLLLKPSSLNKNEYKLIQEHVNIGFHMLEQIPMFKKISIIINSHHERLDGSGYPNALKGDEIPIESNIMGVADTFDAMTTNRIYKGRKSKEEALKEIESLSNILFKKEIVNAAIKVLKEIDINENINQLPQTILEEERFSYFYKDPLTELFNEQYLDFILSKNSYNKKYTNINIVFLNNFSKYNKKFGWKKGNQLLKDISKKLSEIYPNSLIFRINGDDFAILEEKGINKNNELIKFINLQFNKISVFTNIINIKENQVYSLEKLESLF